MHCKENCEGIVKCKSRVNIDKMEQAYKPNIYLFI